MLRLFHFPFSAMGSRCEVRLYASDETEAARCAERAIADVRRLDARFSSYRDDSFVAEINRAAAAGLRVDVDDETATLLDYAATCFEQSDGLFDITAGVLREAWERERPSLPDPGLLRSLLDRVGFDKLVWRRPTLRFGVAGMALDFGGLVKEYATDRAAVICADAGFTHGLVDLGGDIRIVGPHPDGAPWSVGIRHPRRPGEVMASIDLPRGAVATSGDYERFVEIDGRRYSHIVSPLTGMPVRMLASVSVVAEECIVAGSATTIAMLLEERAPKWLREVGLPHIFMDQDMRIGGTLSPDLAASQARMDRRQSRATA
jgi:thiamine biosynthesis lipoprotein